MGFDLEAHRGGRALLPENTLPAFANALSTIGSYLTWAPLAVIALVVVFFVVRHLRRRRAEDSSAA